LQQTKPTKKPALFFQTLNIGPFKAFFQEERLNNGEARRNAAKSKNFFRKKRKARLATRLLVILKKFISSFL